ncbi:hypothetical protein A2U01_0015504, partial [Trifolium medium]|nr:hypothetical protein [Trifolium medium]
RVSKGTPAVKVQPPPSMASSRALALLPLQLVCMNIQLNEGMCDA